MITKVKYVDKYPMDICDGNYDTYCVGKAHAIEKFRQQLLNSLSIFICHKNIKIGQDHSFMCESSPFYFRREVSQHLVSVLV